MFGQFIRWTNWVNFDNFVDNCWISCQVMADRKKVYDCLTIINLYASQLHIYVTCWLLYAEMRQCSCQIDLSPSCIRFSTIWFEYKITLFSSFSNWNGWIRWGIDRSKLQESNFDFNLPSHWQLWSTWWHHQGRWHAFEVVGI